MSLPGKRVVFGFGGGIAAYKACQALRLLMHDGAQVRAAMTAAATRFVTPLTVQALTGAPVLTDVLEPSQDARYGHLDLARGADLVVIAPATADLIGKIRAGLGDDAVTTTLLAARCPVLLAPAMNVAMWDNEQVQENVRHLRAQRRFRLVGPNTGKLADGDEGAGRLAEPEEILAAARAAVATPDLAGRRVVVTAGPTREHLDPVRYLSNPSTGRMGFALAAAARDRGADVVLIAGPTEIAPPRDVRVVPVIAAEDLARASLAEATGADVFIAAAAVADQRPATRSPRKVKKAPGPETLLLERTPDALLEVSRALAGRTPRAVLVGFAAETEDLVANAAAKLAAKDLDLVVANDVTTTGAGFGSAENEITLVGKGGAARPLPRASKEALAHVILDEVVALLARR